MSKKILVTGATGTLGKSLIKSLQTTQTPFVAAVRNQAKAFTKIGQVPVVEFDFEKPETFQAATQDVDRVFLLAPPLNTGVVNLLKPFIEYLHEKKILRVVYISAMGLELLPELPFHSQLEAELDKKGFNYTILKPSFFAQNFKNYEFENITKHGITYTVAGDGKVGFVDAEDVGRVAATVLTTDGHDKKTYTLTGPALLSYFDAAEELSKVLTKKIIYPNPTSEEYINTLKTAGAPDFVASYMIAVYSLIANHHVNYITNDIEKLTGQKPTSLATVLARDFSADVAS